MTDRPGGRLAIVVVGGGASGVLLAAHLLSDPEADIRVTLIATGFDHGRGGPPRRVPGGVTQPRDRGPRIDDRQRSSLEISDDDLDIPPFLR